MSEEENVIGRKVGDLAEETQLQDDQKEVIEARVGVDQEKAWKTSTKHDWRFQKWIGDELRKELAKNDSTKGLSKLDDESMRKELIARDVRVELINRIFGFYLKVDSDSIEKILADRQEKEMLKNAVVGDNVEEKKE